MHIDPYCGIIYTYCTHNMKTITIGEKTITLDVGETLTMKEMRKIYPIMKKYGDNEIEMICQMVFALSPDKGVEDVVNGFGMDEITILSTEVSAIIGDIKDQKKK